MNKLVKAIIAFFLFTFAFVACGGDRFEATPDILQDASTEPANDAGQDVVVEHVHDATPDAIQKPDVVADNSAPEADVSTDPIQEPDVVADVVPMDVVQDSISEPPPYSPLCYQNGAEGKIMVYASAGAINSSLYVTVFGSVKFPPSDPDAGDASPPDIGWNGWCWSDQGVGQTICFPKLANNERAPAFHGTVVDFQPGITGTYGATPSTVLCQFNKCAIGTYTVCAGFYEVCKSSGGVLSGSAFYVDPDQNGQVHIVCTL